MRSRFTPAILALIALLAIPASEQPSAESAAFLLADAEQASVVNPVRYHMEDHYGDPSRFVKYIIRRPPTLA